MTLTTIFHRAPVIEKVDGQDVVVGTISSNPDELLNTPDPRDEPTFEPCEPQVLSQDEGQKPPLTNRGVEREPSLEQDMPVSCHWFHGTTNIPLKEVLANLPKTLGFEHLLKGDFSNSFPDCWQELPHGGFRGYTVSYRLLKGISVCVNPERPEMKVLILITGDGCELLGDDVLKRVFDEYFDEGKGKVTRFDVAIDNCPFTPQQLYEEWKKDNVRTRCKAPDPQKVEVKQGMEGIRTHGWHSNVSGDTLYMGSRESSQYARCYDQRGFTRFELEAHKARAHELARCYLSCDGTRGEIAMGAIREFVDFVDSTQSTKRTDCSLLPFWNDFVQGIDRLCTSVSQTVERTIERTKEWIENSVSATFYTYVSAIEGLEHQDLFGIFKRLLWIGYSRLKPKHEILLRTIGQEPTALRFSPDGGL